MLKSKAIKDINKKYLSVGYSKVSESNLKKNYSSWSSPDTTTIRVPRHLKDKLLELAKELDSEKDLIIFSKQKLESIYNENMKRYRSPKSLISFFNQIIN